MKVIFCMLLALGLARPSMAVQPDSVWAEAQHLYDSLRQYDSAMVRYQSLVDSGYRSPELFYNLGNAAYRAGYLGRAILSYERGLLLLPGDEDLKHNLALANLRIVDKRVDLRVSLADRIATGILSWMSAESWGRFGLMFAWFGLIGMVVLLLLRLRRFRRGLFVISVLAFVLSVSAMLLAQARHDHDARRELAIVMAQNVNGQSEPKAGATKLFVLHEGSKVRIRRKSGTWYEVEFAGDKIGWVPEAAIELI